MNSCRGRAVAEAHRRRRLRAPLQRLSVDLTSWLSSADSRTTRIRFVCSMFRVGPGKLSLTSPTANMLTKSAMATKYRPHINPFCLCRDRAEVHADNCHSGLRLWTHVLPNCESVWGLHGWTGNSTVSTGGNSSPGRRKLLHRQMVWATRTAGALNWFQALILWQKESSPC